MNFSHPTPLLSQMMLLGVGSSGAGVTFDPLLDLVPTVWLDADAESMANNDPVATWADQSGNGNDFTEATNKPTFKTNVLNGKAGIYFDGGDQLLKSLTGAGTDFTIAAVVSRADDLFRVFWTNSLDPYLGVQAGGKPVFYQGASATAYFDAFPGDVDEAMLVGVISDNGTTRVFAGKNVFQAAATTASPLKVSGLSNLGGFQWSGHLFEVLATETALTDEQWSGYADYLISKWGLADRRILMLDGDSITQGSGASDYAHSWAGLLTAELGEEWQVENQGISGQTIGDSTGGGGPAEYMSLNAAIVEYTLGHRSAGSNVLIAWGGTNDLFYGESAATAYSRYVSYCQAAQAAGYKVIASTMLDRNPTGSWLRADMQTFNTSVRTNWATFADALVDPLTADSRFDDDTSALFADQVHPNDAGHAILHPLFKAAMDGLTLT